MSYTFLDDLYDELMRIVAKVTIKRDDLARENETTEYANSFETYKACLTNIQYFYTFTSFDTAIILKYCTDAEYIAAKENINNIPEDVRDAIIAEQTAVVLESYEEKNNYYRMLMGLPDYESTSFHYIDGRDDIDDTIPIHELDSATLLGLEDDGTIASLIEEYPDDIYLKYLGSHAIDFYDARTARPFDLLQIGSPNNSRYADMFREMYYRSRKYVLANIYNKEIFTSLDLYEPIIGMIIIIMAMRTVMAPSDNDYLNFEEILDNILESYGMLSYFSSFPFTYKKRIVMNMDKLLMVKGTDGVIVDVCNLFNLGEFTASRYYLLKTQTKDEFGKIVVSEDLEEAYSLQFVRVEIGSSTVNTQEEYLDSYYNITTNDILWQLSDDEYKSLLEEKFNLMMTKYIGVETAYDVTTLAFETCIFVNLLLKAKVNLDLIQLPNQYSYNGYSSAFTMVVFMLAIMAKRSEFDGNIVYEPDDMATIMRLNVELLDEEIQALVDKYELHIEGVGGILGDFKVNMTRPEGTLNSVEFIDVYTANRDLFDAILEEQATTNEVLKYQTLQELKDLLFFSAMQQITFTKVNGTIASTYHDMLQNQDDKLTTYLDSVASDDLDDLLVYILEQLEAAFDSPELEFLFISTPNVFTSLTAKYLRQAIDVFKASSVQLSSISAFFYFGDRDPMRAIDKVILNKEDVADTYVSVTDDVTYNKTLILDDYITTGDNVITEII